MREVLIVKVGTSDNGRPYAIGATQFDGEEEMAALRKGYKGGGVKGPVNGIDDAHIAALNVGDRLLCDDVRASVTPATYELDGAEREGFNTAIRLSGKVSRTQAPACECDW